MIKEALLKQAACRHAEDVFFPRLRTVDIGKEMTPTDARITLVRGVRSGSDRCAACCDECTSAAAAEDPLAVCSYHPDAEQRPTSETKPLPRCAVCCTGCAATADANDSSVMCDSHPDAERLERLREAEARQICVACPVRAQCLADVASDDHQPIGVFGGLNRWERMWLQAADPDQKQELRSLGEALTPQQCIELREDFIEHGPPRSGLRGVMPNEIAVRYGVPTSVAARWVERAGSPKPHKGRTPQTEAILLTLGEGEWIERSVVQAAAEQAVPLERARDTADERGVTEERAREMIAFRCIDDRKTCRSILEREIGGVSHMRLIPRLPGKARAKAKSQTPAGV